MRAVNARSIRHALAVAGGDAAGATVVFPIDGERFFGPAVTEEAAHRLRAAQASPRARVAPRGGAGEGLGLGYRAGQEGGAATPEQTAPA